MNILILGGGGREHALAWAFAQNPKCDRLWCAPGNAGIAEEATCVALDILDGDKVLGFCRENDIGFVLIGPEAPLAEGVADVLRSGGIPTLGPGRAAARLEASKAFAKEICAACGAPTAASQTFTDPEAARAYVAARGRADRGQGRRPRGRQGRDRRRQRGRGAAGAGRDLPRGSGRAGGDRGVHGRRGSQPVPARGRRGHLPARHRPGPQARLRRRPGPEHRRHGRLFPGAGADAGADRGRGRADRPPDAGRDGPARHAVPGRALCRADDRGRRAAAGGIQRPLRRSRGAGAGDAAGRAAPGRLLRGGDRRRWQGRG